MRRFPSANYAAMADVPANTGHNTDRLFQRDQNRSLLDMQLKPTIEAIRTAQNFTSAEGRDLSATCPHAIFQCSHAVAMR
jgi:hypothetical protein